MVAVFAKRRRSDESRFSSALRKRPIKALRQQWTEKMIVLRVNPQHWNARRTAEFGNGIDQLIRGTVVVGFAIETTTAAGRVPAGSTVCRERSTKSGRCIERLRHSDAHVLIMQDSMSNFMTDTFLIRCSPG